VTLVLIHSAGSVQSSSGRRLDRLSRRELEVLRLMAAGRSNAAIAAELYLACKTVETICSHIFRKLDLHLSDEVNRRVLAVLAFLQEDGALIS
jgi:DNA-binding NarL/FixJ family response regulator